uniref:PH domain-containing protein n=1 Tax=Anopheles farauti TaxID=69004 RepID=A0A182QYC6_9DIPT
MLCVKLNTVIECFASRSEQTQIRALAVEILPTRNQEPEAAGMAATVQGSPRTGDESSESENETEPAKIFHRKLSTKKDVKSATAVKEGYLMKQTWSFQRWRRRYFRLKGHKLYYAKDSKHGKHKHHRAIMDCLEQSLQSNTGPEGAVMGAFVGVPLLEA